VSMNSVREKCYTAYFRPKGYRFGDVLESIALGIDRGRHVAINYLNMAGVTDSPEETKALFSFLEAYPIHQIQWRNMNYDPLRYMKAMTEASPHTAPIGMRNLVKEVEARFPALRHGYFNPHLKRG
jgi:pyruvate-formate lyase-activating enzyme